MKGGWADLLEKIVGKPESVCLTSDSELHRLSSGPPLPAFVSERVFGEALFRRWLYAGGVCPACIHQTVERSPIGLKTFVLEELLPAKSEKAEEEILSSRRIRIEAPCGTERWMTGRILSFRRAEGFIAVVQAQEAYPIPFRVDGLAGGEQCFWDAAGRPVVEWEREAEAVWAVMERYRVVVDLNLETAAGPKALTGGSFALPLMLTARFDEQRFFDPMSVLVTGALRNGCVVEVQGIPLKMDLARRMGVKLFAAPSSDLIAGAPEMHTLGIPPGTRWSEAVDKLHAALQEAALCSLNIPLARRGITMLTRASATGRVSNARARDQCERLLKFLRANFQPVLAASIHHGELLLASIDNHEGFPERAMERLRKLMDAQLSKNSSSEVLRAMPHLIVSLCDSGRLKAADEMGRKLVCDVDSLFKDNTDLDLEMRARVYGVAGGQSMLQLALRTGDKSLEEQSFQLLMKSREISAQLSLYESGLEGPVDYSGWASRGAVQVATWHALFQTGTFEVAVTEAATQFRPKTGDISAEFLRRVRFLGAYRNWLTTGHISEYRSWESEVPSEQSPSWVLATVLKYRGSLRAADQRLEEAAQDFYRALKILEKEEGELIRVIAWSTAAQALRFAKDGDVLFYKSKMTKFFPCVAEYLRRCGSGLELYTRLSDTPEDPELIHLFQTGFLY